MNPLLLHEFHQSQGANFLALNGAEVAGDYGDPAGEHAALRASAGILDLSFRGRLCLTGADRGRYLHGQVTNDVNRLRPGGGCYAALVTAKGRMESDLNIFCLQDEILLDFEPGLTARILQRLQKFIVADDVQVTDVAGLYGLLSAQGPKSEGVVRSLGVFSALPGKPFDSIHVADALLGDLYLVNLPRLGSAGFDLFVPVEALGAAADKLILAAKSAGGRACGWRAFEEARIEAGIPRFGADMDETNIPLECGIESRAVNYNKGCYIGQEVINRIHSIGHVNRELRGFRLEGNLASPPRRGDKLFLSEKEVGHVTTAAKSRVTGATIALGYAHRGANAPGTELVLRTDAGEAKATVVELPFIPQGT